MSTNTYLAALEYLDMGWSVIPCDGKKPLIQWQEFTERRATVEEVERWWQRWPKANVAIVTGSISSLVVVDVDTHRGGQTKDLPETLKARTGGGGWHYFYGHPGGKVQNQVGDDGLDVRADGGYVIAAPSVHASGERYEWEGGEVTYPSPAAPVWAIKGRTKPEGSGADLWITALLRGDVEAGTRNDSVARLAGYWAKKQIPVDTAVEMVQSVVRGWPAPLSREEVEITVRSIFRTAKRAATGYTGLSLTPCSEFMKENLGKETQWLIPGWLPDETIAFVVAAPGAYKTWMTLDLAWAVASGRPFLGSIKPTRTGPVLLFQQEDYGPQTAERLATVAGMTAISREGYVTETGADFDVPIYHHTEAALRIDNEEVLEDLTRAIEKIRPVLVICDPLYSIVSQEDHMARAVEHLFALKRLRDEYGCTFVVAAHSKKSRDKLHREGLLGSQLVNAFLETGWQCEKKSETSILVRRHFKTAPPQKVLQLDFDISTSEGRFDVDMTEVSEDDVETFVSGGEKQKGGGKKTSTPSRTQWTYLEAMPGTMGDIARILGRDKKTVRQMLSRLVEQGFAEKGADDRWVPIDLPSF